MSTTTESATTEVTTKEGVEIKGKDVIKLTAPEILPPAGQLLTVAQDIVGALNELKKGLDEKGSDEWKFPKGWIDIPDPSANQIIMMVEIDDTSVNQPVLAINLESQDGQGGCEGVETIDWGDGYIDSMPFNYKPNYGHKYKEKGQYIITINCSTTMNCLNFDINVWTVGYIDGVSPSTATKVIGSVLRVIIFGSNTALYRNIPNSSDYYDPYWYNGLVYLRFKGAFKSYRTGLAPVFSYQTFLCKVVCDNLPTSIESGAFLHCYCLQDVDFCKHLTSIPQSVFSDCYTLKSIDLPNVTEIGSMAFAQCYNLKKANMPLVTNISSLAFNTCRSLQEITYADGCTIADDSFEYCYSLYPKP